ncbi:hypothetical protein Gpo141_00010522 [Globisporangium polare]
MSSPSSAKINPSSSKGTPTNASSRNTKRDVNVNASRSRAFGASSISNSSRKVNGAGGGQGGGGSSQSARVFLDGADVTPQSLLVSRIKPSTSQDQRSGNKGKGQPTRRSRNTHGTGGGGGNSVMGASVVLSNASTSSLDEGSDTDVPPTTSSSNNNNNNRSSGNATKTSGGAVKASVVPASPVTVASPGSSTPAANTNQQNDDEDGVGPESDETAVTAAQSEASKPKVSETSSAAVTSSTNQPKSEKTRRRPITIELAETPTMMVFELRSVCVGADANHHQAVAARNRQYLEVCAARKGSDKFVEGRSQTLQLAQKGKEVMTAPPATRDAMCVATDWDIFDCARIEEDNPNEHDEGGGVDTPSTTGASTSGGAAGGGITGAKSARASSEYENGELQLKHQVDEIVDATLVSPGCVLDVDGDIVEDLRARQHARTRRVKHGGGNKSKGHHATTTTNSSGANTQGSQQDFGRSSAVNAMMSNSSSSMTSPSQSGANLSFGTSQQDVGGGGMDDSGNSSAQNSQVGMSSASHGVLSGGSSGGGGDDNKQNAYARANTNVDIGETIAQQRTRKVLASASLLKTVSIVERAVQQNVYHQQHVLYRNFPSLATSDDDRKQGGSHHRQHDDGAGGNDWRSMRQGSSGVGSANGSFSGFPSGASSSAGGGLGGTRNGGAVGGKGALEKLWAFQCELTEGRRVSCLAWNTVNEDLLAVSYCSSTDGRGDNAPVANNNAGNLGAGGGYYLGTGQPLGSVTSSGAGADGPATGADDEGLILFWSLKNPEYPERVYNLGAGVMSIDFSHTQPYLLAVGFVNGVVAIYDTRKDDSAHTGGHEPGSTGAPGSRLAPESAAALKLLHTPAPIASSEVSTGKHLDVLWQVKWISKGSDRGENVVSISSDGRVTEWSMKKGLSYSDLMTLKRIVNPLLGSDSRADGVISRQASGHCIDFAKNDPSVYFVGTEDGLIHKCSVSYNEQYLQTYLGHTGPVYQILVSPFCSDLFLSCSGDWNIKLWHQGEQREVLNFRSVDLAHAVHGISWCPSDATIFGAVSEDGRIEIWDLQQSTLDPVITHFPKRYARVSENLASAVPSAPGANSTSGAPGGNDAGGLDNLDDPLLPSAPSAQGGGANASRAFGSSLSQPELLAPLEIPLECTKIAFAPSAPIIVVGDSTGDVTVYRVPTLADGCNGENMSVDEQIAKLHRAMNPNKHE